MTVPRYGHTGTLLANGKVLVAGGFSLPDDGLSAELYDPDTGTWSLTGPLSVTRNGHTATRLSGGSVLVASGETSFTSTPTAEIYEPATGTWSATGPMGTRRFDHTAVLMDQAPCGDLCGKVLVSGGQVEPSVTSSATVATNSAEVFDPATRTWAAIAVFHTARSGHTATLLRTGKVLVSGGTTGTQSGPATDSVRLFDPVTRSATSTGSLTAGRFDHTATRLPGGEVLVTGGSVAGSNQPDASAELYNPLTGEWSSAGSMEAGRSNHTASLLGSGDVLVAGSFDNTSTELYGPPLPVASVGDVAVHEGDAGSRAAVFTVSLSKPSPAGATMAYATASGTAGGTGYTPRSGTVSFAEGSTKATVKVPVTGDVTDDGDETFTLGLSSPAGATIGDGTGVGTILDDDPATIVGRRVAIGDVAVHEGDTGARAAVFTVSLSKSSTNYVWVNFATAKGSAIGTDFTAKSGRLSFAPGTTGLTVVVPITPDTIAEGNESFTVKLSGASGATIADATGVGTIIDND